ncbi:MAG: hypothetical protein EZS28_035736 [Streblomastix strix]|uniref:Uncharacterized protein n=1 Tax=Streblomastix strix TaxID=222440 RepID=A0A5J4UED9_9EUKA|nr:MAG: hypothetical protein EZS28_035736 [Streblomastix strix]
MQKKKFIQLNYLRVPTAQLANVPQLLKQSDHKLKKGIIQAEQQIIEKQIHHLDPTITAAEVHAGVFAIDNPAARRRIYGEGYPNYLLQKIYETSIRVNREGKLMEDQYMENNQRYKQNINARQVEAAMNLGSKRPVITEEQQRDQLMNERPLLYDIGALDWGIPPINDIYGRTPFETYDTGYKYDQFSNPIAYIKKPTQPTKLNYLCPLYNKRHKSLSPHPQQHSPSPSLEETLAILRTISPGDPRVYKEKEPERKQPKLQQYEELMDIVKRFQQIMKPIMGDERRNARSCYQDSTKNIRTRTVLLSSIHLRTIAKHQCPESKIQISRKNNGINLMRMYARAQSPFAFDQPTTSKLRRISQREHTSQDYQTSVMEWLDSLTYTPKFTNQYLKQQQAQSYSQQNKLYN